MLRCLGYSATIAIASCSATGHDYKQDEVPASTYADIARDLRLETPKCRAIAREAIRDGKITYGELEQLNACDEQARNDAVDLAAAKAEIAQPQPSEHERRGS
jgi:hypothetical protein